MTSVVKNTNIPPVVHDVCSEKHEYTTSGAQRGERVKVVTIYAKIAFQCNAIVKALYNRFLHCLHWQNYEFSFLKLNCFLIPIIWQIFSSQTKKTYKNQSTTAKNSHFLPALVLTPRQI